MEQEKFMEIGSYLQRTSPATMELRMTQNVAPDLTKILQSLSSNIHLAKDLVGKCNTALEPITDTGVTELKSIIKQLEEVIRNIGRELSLIPSSTYENRNQLSDMDEQKLDIPSEEERENREVEHSVEEIYEESHKTSLGSRTSEMPCLIDFLTGMYYGEKENGSQSFKALPQLAEYIEPLYETFFCPLTKKIMGDPVTIGSGITYERKAILECFEKFNDRSEDTVCPTTGKKLQNRVLNTNIALKATIAEWRLRNEATRLRVARTALLLASSEAMVLDAIHELQHLSRKGRNCKPQMHSIGITELLTQFVEHEDKKVRCETLDILCLLVEDDTGKEIITNTRAIASAVKMLSSSYDSERSASVSFLFELSKSELLCENIGSVTGSILMLIRMKYDESSDPLASGKAEQTLKNLEKCPRNIKCMAECGFLDPLLDHLIEGTEEIQMEMVSYLSELVLGDDMKAYVSEKVSLALIKMVHSGNTLTRKAALKALVQISSYHPNSRTLTDAGAVPIMVEEIFTCKIHNEPMDSKEEASAILANILESAAHPESLKVNKHGHTMASEYFIYNIAHMLKFANPDEVNTNLIRILLCLAKLRKTLASVVSVTKETEVCSTIIAFLNSPRDELVITTAELIIILSSHIGHSIAERLCKTRGQPEGLIKKLETDGITRLHSISVSLLAKLPHQNLALNLALLHRGTVPIILSNIQGVQRGETRASRHTRSYLEGLVGVLVRFTTTLYDHDVLCMAREHNLTSVFTQLLMRTTGSDEVQRLSATALERLSLESINLSRLPLESKRPKRSQSLLRLFSVSHAERKEREAKLCPVHQGRCSPSLTFCLLESRAVERLVGCLEHENAQVVDAALSAICTLLDDRVDVDRSVEVLGNANVLQQVLAVLREHRDEGVRHKSFQVIERFLMKGGERSITGISNDMVLPLTLVSAYHHGRSNTRQIAESILRHLNRMPHVSRNMIT